MPLFHHLCLRRHGWFLFPQKSMGRGNWKEEKITAAGVRKVKLKTSRDQTIWRTPAL
jgi:hypothetical protein